LEKGIGQLESTKYRIEAASLQVEADKPGATARVQLTGPQRVVVAARDGSVRVSNGDGVLIARLDSGREMVFEPQEGGAAALTKVSGILALKDGKFILVDRITNVTMELQGAGLEAEVGNLVEITGTVDSAAPTVAGASQIIDVTSIKRLTKGARAAGAAGAGARSRGCGSQRQAAFPPAPSWPLWAESPRRARLAAWRQRTICRGRAQASQAPAGSRRSSLVNIEKRHGCSRGRHGGGPPSVSVGLRPTNGDETQLEGGQYWPQPALGRLRAGLPALQSGFRLCAGPPGPALGPRNHPKIPTWARYEERPEEK
jgi:hypothetical protein